MAMNRWHEQAFQHLLPLALADQEVHVWRAQLDRPVQDLAHLAQLLSPDEQARAHRFRFAVDRQRFIIGRGLLRTILSCYLPVAADRLTFTYGPHGKPSLNNAGLQPLSFNMSHSNQIALYAITRDRQVGIDVECVRSLHDMEQLAQRFFLPNEAAWLTQGDASQRQELFFRLWTCKEAYLKATGEGLTGLKRIEITQLPEPLPADRSPTELPAEIAIDQMPTTQWTVIQLVPWAGYVAALAIARQTMEPDLAVSYYAVMP
jgi:4'-phosphopantetheinyl transferase